MHLRSFLGDHLAALSDVNLQRLLQHHHGSTTCVFYLHPTEAFGIGCDIPELEYGIQYGDVESLVQFEQPTGRRGWNGSGRARLIDFASRETFGADHDGKCGPVPTATPVKKETAA